MKADNGRINELCDVIDAALKAKASEAAKEDASEAIAELRLVTS